MNKKKSFILGLFELIFEFIGSILESFSDNSGD
jgi:hypothetical protein